MTTDKLLTFEGPLLVTGVPEGLDALVIGQMARASGESGAPKTILHIARDDQRMEALRSSLKFFAKDIPVVSLPAWDCVPYDRVSPNADISARRVTALAKLALSKRSKPHVVLTTVNAALQRVPSRQFFKRSVVQLAGGNIVDMDALAGKLERFGYFRTGTVMDKGEFAVRGGIVDLFPAGHSRPIRLDFFGDTLESIRSFDPATQRTATKVDKLVLLPVSEVPFGKEAKSRFRQNYVELFGAVKGDDPLYEAVSSGTRFQGMEHWLPLFHDKLETVFDYVPGAVLTFDHLAEDARTRRLEQIDDHYDARVEALEQKAFGAAPYKPVPASSMFLNDEEWKEFLHGETIRSFTPFEIPEGSEAIESLSLGGRRARSFASERAAEGVNVFEAAAKHIVGLRKQGKRTIVACWTNGARERVSNLLKEHGLGAMEKADSWQDVLLLDKSMTALSVLGLENGFETADFSILGEQDILGDRLVRQSKRKKSGSDVLQEASSLTPGDLIVHADHGIGQFVGLKTIEAGGAPHDCLELSYHGGDKLYLPVENIELLSRYGSDDAGVQLDRLGGGAWQARKSRLKKRLRDMAQALIAVAAARLTREAPIFELPEGPYEEFCMGFPYEETEDQLNSIDAVIEDLASGRPMDRLVCGDVGFGKTEVALRSAFVTVMAGKQVAVVVPTTLLARQHFKTFSERFKGLPVRVAQASRLVSTKELNSVKEGVKNGEVDIVVGTHALLGKSISFADLGLLVIDEEQHFGVQHKERIKQLRDDVHVLTLSATPIPRTLQLALTGVRELSLITTPPVDRLAVRTFITPFDPVILREALLRERYRGGQSFYVCPRISDLDEAEAFLKDHVPELKITRAHGQMPTGELDDVMNAFYDRKYDVLLSTTIVESGLDIPTANTLIVHRADMFGLAQLYQLRGRVGRSKTRAYAYFTIPANKPLTATAEKRLNVLQSLDTLGAGFSLASHDLDIRGGGNLLGEEQSGHIREVGFELYQSMLEEAIATLKGGGEHEEDQWSPQISIGTSVLIPEHYVQDLQVRLGLYRRLSSCDDAGQIDELAAELADRFGPVPDEVEHLLDIVQIKVLCREAGVAQVDAGPKGAVLSFRNNAFANPAGLLEFVQQQGRRVKLQPDHKLVYREDWDLPEDRLRGTRQLVKKLAAIAAESKKAA